ncbi:MAG: RES domain-containing protein [Alphaproteobacteria bacterium]|nr:RES domain-containing protein [Alphaproteobacteria bacterium]
MSSPISTADALSFEPQKFTSDGWRFVEAQHIVSTQKLVDTPDEQQLLEELIDGSKPAIPVYCQHLDYLLFTPFRYDAPYPSGSRFRRAGRTPGIWYGSETPETAAAEMVFYRLLFFAESPDTPRPTDPAQYTAFSAALHTEHSIDLTAPPLNAQQNDWTDPINYGPCQTLADQARAVEIALIRYDSVRDPKAGKNIAVLSCSAFAKPEPTDRQTWRIHLGTFSAIATREFPKLTLEFTPDMFANDPRLKPQT